MKILPLELENLLNRSGELTEEQLVEPSSALKPNQRNESSYLILINHMESNIHVSKNAQHKCKKRENVIICFSQSCNHLKSR